MTKGKDLKEPLRNYIATRLGSGFLLIACGLPSSGKSAATRLVAELTGYPILRTDLIRRELLKSEDVFDETAASNMEKRTIVYEEMFKYADKILRSSQGLVLDATFITQSLRKRAAEIAVRHNLSLIILETVCPEEVALKRIRTRTRESSESNALTEQAYFNNKRLFEEVDLDDLKKSFPTLTITHLVVDTGREFPDWYVVKEKV